MTSVDFINIVEAHTLIVDHILSDIFIFTVIFAVIQIVTRLMFNPLTLVKYEFARDSVMFRVERP